MQPKFVEAVRSQSLQRKADSQDEVSSNRACAVDCLLIPLLSCNWLLVCLSDELKLSRQPNRKPLEPTLAHTIHRELSDCRSPTISDIITSPKNSIQDVEAWVSSYTCYGLD